MWCLQARGACADWGGPGGLRPRPRGLARVNCRVTPRPGTLRGLAWVLFRRDGAFRTPVRMSPPVAFACVCILLLPHSSQSLHLWSRALLEGACPVEYTGLYLPCGAIRDPGFGRKQTPKQTNKQASKQYTGLCLSYTQKAPQASAPDE